MRMLLSTLIATTDQTKVSTKIILLTSMPSMHLFSALPQPLH